MPSPRFLAASLLTLLTLLVSLGAPLRAADEAKGQHVYEGEVTGVVCAACKMHISQQLMEKLHGTVSVDVKRGENEGRQKIVIVSTEPGVTLDTATQALGDLASTYTIVNLAEKKAE